MKKLHVLALAALALLTAPVASFAQFPDSWTSACSAGATIDEVSVPIYAVGPPLPSGAFIAGLTIAGFPTPVGTVVARYNVTNTSFPPTPVPPWDTLELGYTDTAPAAGDMVTATLYSVAKCSGLANIICSVSSPTNGTNCVFCTFPAGTVIDFTINLYFVQVTVAHPVLGGTVSANTLRIYNTPP